MHKAEKFWPTSYSLIIDFFNGIAQPLEKVFHINECTKGLFLSFKRRIWNPNAVRYSKLPIHVKTWNTDAYYFMPLCLTCRKIHMNKKAHVNFHSITIVITNS